ncbi:MAG: hypothetical protein ABMA01_10430 [Chthoniobacteraceae bacterium]
MIQGPDVVLACPHCEALSRLFTVAAADGSGCLSWTDGYQELPMTPAQPNVSRCRKCAKLMWVAQCPTIGLIEKDGPAKPEEAEWRELPYLEPVDEADYLEAVNSGMASFPEQETELRVFAWWRGNDRYRRLEGPGRHPTSPEAVANLERVVELLKDGEHEFVLFRAEALRELGRFDEAREALHGLCSDYALARERIAELVENKSRDIELLFASEPQT